MAKTLNRVELIGHLGRDPELRYTEQGTEIATFSVATNRYRQGPDGQAHEETEWHPVVAWDKLAEICNTYLRKGRRVYVEGRLQTRKWRDNAGQEHSRTEIVASEVLLLDRPDRDETSGVAESLDEEDAPPPSPC